MREIGFTEKGNKLSNLPISSVICSQVIGLFLFNYKQSIISRQSFLHVACSTVYCEQVLHHVEKQKG